MFGKEKVKPTYWAFKKQSDYDPRPMVIRQLETVTAKRLCVAQTAKYVIFDSATAEEINDLVQEAVDKNKLLVFTPDSSYKCGGRVEFLDCPHKVDFISEGNVHTMFVVNSKNEIVADGFAPGVV